MQVGLLGFPAALKLEGLSAEGASDCSRKDAMGLLAFLLHPLPVCHQTSRPILADLWPEILPTYYSEISFL